MMKAVVDKDVCVGCGLCTSTAPDVFQMTDEGTAEAYAEGEAAAIEQAIDDCPVSAISKAD